MLQNGLEQPVGTGNETPGCQRNILQALRPAGPYECGYHLHCRKRCAGERFGLRGFSLPGLLGSHNATARGGGLEGQKGALWWQIYRILQEKGDSRPNYLMYENVDRLINSPAQQRGRDFAVILGSLAQLGYIVEWRVINAASYGMPQRRSRVYMVGYHSSTRLAAQCEAVGDWYEWALRRGVLAAAFACEAKDDARVSFSVRGAEENSPGALAAGGARSPFRNAGVMVHGDVRTLAVSPCYEGPRVLLGDLLVPDGAVPASFYIDAADVPKWEYAKGGKSFQRINRTTGFAYRYSEGAMAFPDDVGRPSRTVVTGEGGAGPSRFKHVVRCEGGRLRRLVPLELERLNMFPDDYTGPGLLTVAVRF